MAELYHLLVLTQYNVKQFL